MWSVKQAQVHRDNILEAHYSNALLLGQDDPKQRQRCRMLEGHLAGVH